MPANASPARAQASGMLQLAIGPAIIRGNGSTPATWSRAGSSAGLAPSKPPGTSTHDDQDSDRRADADRGHRLRHPPGPAQEGPASRPFTGPWDVPALLATPPKATWGEAVRLVPREVYYEGEPFDGKPTRIYAYYARPESGDGPFPAMLLLHGGGGKAFREWAELWARRRIALAMDLHGQGPGHTDPRRRRQQRRPGKFGTFSDAEARRMWTYQAVAAVLRGHALLASRKEVDRDRIGVTGISSGCGVSSRGSTTG